MREVLGEGGVTGLGGLGRNVEEALRRHGAPFLDARLLPQQGAGGLGLALARQGDGEGRGPGLEAERLGAQAAPPADEQRRLAGRLQAEAVLAGLVRQDETLDARGRVRAPQIRDRHGEQPRLLPETQVLEGPVPVIGQTEGRLAGVPRAFGGAVGRVIPGALRERGVRAHRGALRTEGLGRRQGGGLRCAPNDAHQQAGAEGAALGRQRLQRQPLGLRHAVGAREAGLQRHRARPEQPKAEVARRGGARVPDWAAVRLAEGHVQSFGRAGGGRQPHPRPLEPFQAGARHAPVGHEQPLGRDRPARAQRGPRRQCRALRQKRPSRECHACLSLFNLRRAACGPCVLP